MAIFTAAGLLSRCASKVVCGINKKAMKGGRARGLVWDHDFKAENCCERNPITKRQ